MDACTQLRNQGLLSSESEIITKCASWFTTDISKREAIFNIMGYYIGHHFDDLAVLTGYSADILYALWRHRKSVNDQYYTNKKSYEKGTILGMHKNGKTIQEIQETVNWKEQDILSLLEEKGL